MKTSPIIFFILSLILIIAAFLWSRASTYPHLSADKCLNRSYWPKECRDDPKCCLIWDEDTKLCRKGTTELGGLKCVSKGQIGPLILAVLSGVSFVTCIISIFYTRKNIVEV